MEEDELMARSKIIYDLADEIISQLHKLEYLDTELAVATVSAAYANIAFNCDVSLHDAIDLFVTFYKQMVQKGAAH